MSTLSEKQGIYNTLSRKFHMVIVSCKLQGRNLNHREQIIVSDRNILYKLRCFLIS